MTNLWTYGRRNVCIIYVRERVHYRAYNEVSDISKMTGSRSKIYICELAYIIYANSLYEHNIFKLFRKSLDRFTTKINKYVLRAETKDFVSQLSLTFFK